MTFHLATLQTVPRVFRSIFIALTVALLAGPVALTLQGCTLGGLGGDEDLEEYKGYRGCGNGKCSGREDCETCPEDCGVCPIVCGDGTCSEGEDCTTCEEDCGVCPPTCGDATCDAAAGEDCITCAEDCGVCPPTCGDATCDAAAGEDCVTCEEDCGVCPPTCGDATCDAAAGEDCITCAEDCGVCGPTCDLATDPTLDPRGPTLGDGAHPDAGHNAGLACRACHNGILVAAGAPEFSFAGTLYPTSAGTLFDPANPDERGGATMTVVDANGDVVKVVTSANGNFWTEQPVAFPLQSIMGSSCPDWMEMPAEAVANANSGEKARDCNSCHTGTVDPEIGTVLRVHLRP